tara:strand:- start:182 stop:454 length:273 start_codon:yes stop_codon:yes gene_type:complete
MTKHTYQAVINEAIKAAQFNSADPDADVNTRTAKRTTPSVTTNKQYVRFLEKEGLMTPNKKEKVKLENPNENTLKRYTAAIQEVLKQNTV